MTDRRRRPLLAPLILLALVAALVPWPGPATATATAAWAQATPAGVLELRAQTTWWTAEQPFVLELGVQAAAPESLEVAVGVFRKIPNRTEFANTVGGRTVGRAVDEAPPVPLGELPVDDEGDRILSFVPTVRATGVYPVRVELRPVGGGAPVDSFVTYLVHAPAELPGDRLAVAVVLPVHAPPAVQPDGRVAIDDARAEELAELADSVVGHPTIGLSVAATPETAEALAGSPRDEDRSTMSALAAGLGDRQLLGGPYVPTNLTSMLQAGLSEESAGQLTRGSDTLRRLFGRAPSTDVRLVDERLTEEGTGFLQTQQGARRLVVPEALLEPISRRTTLTSTFELQGRGQRVPAATADAGLAAHFDERDPVLGAQRLLADLAVLYNDDPAAARRGVVASPPRTWSPSGDFTEALLDGLATSPLLEGVTLDRFFEAVAPATTGSGSRAVTLLRRIAPAPPGTPATPALPGAMIADRRRSIDAFASAVDPTNPILDRLDRTLLVVASADLRPRDRIGYLDGVAAQVQAEVSRIAMPQNRSITLTAREGEIPVTITSNTGYPVRVVLRVVSDTLEFPDGASQELELVRRNTTSQFAVRAQASGSFPLRVRLESPEGLVLAESKFTVRSTAVSGVGTALSIGAVLFLAVWWGNHLRGRRSRRLVPAGSGSTSGSAADS